MMVVSEDVAINGRMTTAIPRTRTRTFAHVGKMVEGQNAETADSSRARRQPTDARERPASARPPRRKLGRVGVHTGAGACACGLARSGLPRAAPLGRPPRGQVLTRRLRLRPGSVGRALPLVPRPDRRAL